MDYMDNLILLYSLMRSDDTPLIEAISKKRFNDLVTNFVIQKRTTYGLKPKAEKALASLNQEERDKVNKTVQDLAKKHDALINAIIRRYITYARGRLDYQDYYNAALLFLLKLVLSGYDAGQDYLIVSLINQHLPSELKKAIGYEYAIARSVSMTVSAGVKGGEDDEETSFGDLQKVHGEMKSKMMGDPLGLFFPELYGDSDSRYQNDPNLIASRIEFMRTAEHEIQRSTERFISRPQNRPEVANDCIKIFRALTQDPPPQLRELAYGYMKAQGFEKMEKAVFLPIVMKYFKLTKSQALLRLRILKYALLETYAAVTSSKLGLDQMMMQEFMPKDKVDAVEKKLSAGIKEKGRVSAIKVVSRDSGNEENGIIQHLFSDHTSEYPLLFFKVTGNSGKVLDQNDVDKLKKIIRQEMPRTSTYIRLDSEGKTPIMYGITPFKIVV